MASSYGDEPVVSSFGDAPVAAAPAPAPVSSFGDSPVEQKPPVSSFGDAPVTPAAAPLKEAPGLVDSLSMENLKRGLQVFTDKFAQKAKEVLPGELEQWSREAQTGIKLPEAHGPEITPLEGEEPSQQKKYAPIPWLPGLPFTQQPAIAAALYNKAVVPLVNFATSPVGVTTGMATKAPGILGDIVKPIISGYFAADTSKHAIEEAPEQIKTILDPDASAEKKIDAGTGLFVNAALPISLIAHTGTEITDSMAGMEARMKGGFKSPADLQAGLDAFRDGKAQPTVEGAGDVVKTPPAIGEPVTDLSPEAQKKWEETVANTADPRIVKTKITQIGLMDPDQFKAWNDELKSRGTLFTNEALAVGEHISKDPAALKRAKTELTDAQEEARDALQDMKGLTGNALLAAGDRASMTASKVQYFNDIVMAAEGTHPIQAGSRTPTQESHAVQEQGTSPLDVQPKTANGEGVAGAPAHPLEVVHFSGASDLGVALPSKMHPRNPGINGVYFYERGSGSGQDEGVITGAGRTAYRATLDADKLYDWTTDKDGLIAKNLPNRDAAEQAVKDAGYDGIRQTTEDGRKVVKVFNDTPVEKLLNSESAKNSKSGVFASSNIAEDLTVAEAEKRMGSPEQGKFLTEARIAAPNAIILNALGDWRDAEGKGGAEHSVAALWDEDHPQTMDQVRQVAAKLGLKGMQKETMAFVADEAGKDTLHQIQFNHGESLSDARARLEAAGIPFRTLVPTPEGITALVLDSGNKLSINDLLKLTEGDKPADITSVSVTSERLGDLSDKPTRARAADAYQRVLDETASSRGKAPAGVVGGPLGPSAAQAAAIAQAQSPAPAGRGFIAGSAASNWARQILADRATHITSGLDPIQAAASLIRGAELLETFTRDKLQWAKQMVQEVGEEIKPYLDAMYQHATEMVDQNRSATSIKNATVDMERLMRGMPRAMQAAAHGFGEAWDEAMNIVGRDDGFQQKLIDSLRENPRAVTDVEDALLLHRQVVLQNEYNKNLQVIQAGESREAIDQATSQTAVLSDQLLDLYKINKEAGTETGRGLNARKMLAKEDFSLINMEMQKRAANDGNVLNAEQHTQLDKSFKAISDAQRQADVRIESEQERQSTQGVQDFIDRAKAGETRATDPLAAKAQTLADRIMTVLHTQADAARARMRERMTHATAGIDPTMLADMTIIATEHIAQFGLDAARFTREMIGEWGERVRPYLKDAYEAADKKVTEHAEKAGAVGEEVGRVRQSLANASPIELRTAMVDGIKNAVDAGRPVADLGRYIQKIAESFVREGIDTIDPLIDATHQVLREAIDPTITRRQTREAIGGYGVFRQLSMEEIDVKMRDLKGQAQLLSKLDDLENKRPLKKSGVQQREKTDTQRRLEQQVNEAKRRFGVVVTDPASQLKSALDSRKTRLTNEIADLDFEIANKKRIVPDRTPQPTDAEVERLTALRDSKRAERDELLPKPGITDEQRIASAITHTQNEIERYTANKAAGVVTETRQGRKLSDPRLDAERARLSALKEENQMLRDLLDPKRKNRVANQVFRARMAAMEADYTDRLATKNFAPRTIKPLDLDAISRKAQATANRAKMDWMQGLAADRASKLNTSSKLMNLAARLKRFDVLSSPITVAKLGAAAVQRIGQHALEEVPGYAISKVIPGLAEKARFEGRGTNVAAEAHAITAAMTVGMRDSWETVTKHTSELEALYGRGLDLATGEGGQPIHSVLDTPGRIHGMIKAPVLRAAYTIYYEKLVAWNMAHNIDVHNEGIQLQMHVEAYRYAKRSIFLQDNRLVAGYKAALTRWEQANKDSGKVPFAGKVGVTALRVALPVVKVPANIVAETFEHAVGSVWGLGKLGVETFHAARDMGKAEGKFISSDVAGAFRQGIENLTNEEADVIMRQLKKGSIGAACLVVGYACPNTFGGYYTAGQKKVGTNPSWGSIKTPQWVPLLGGKEIPPYLLHNPLLMTLQLGATIRHVADYKRTGIPLATAVSLLGMTEDVPFFKESLNVSRASESPKALQAFIGENVKSMVVPQAVNWAASSGSPLNPFPGDVNAKGDTIQRNPTTILQHIGTGIPYVRQTIPIKPPAGSKKASGFTMPGKPHM